MKLYHVAVEQDDGWFVGRILERNGVTTQGRTLDELVFMLRDAIHAMWNERNVQLELIIGAKIAVSERKRQPPRRASA
ncbi:MAG: hypothetical protein KIS87_01875 [Phycisphaeraceae bacterium]|nr:hypothetical protein [Phycisphaeraceae bacterium]